jgi:ribonuclease ZC3H12
MDHKLGESSDHYGELLETMEKMRISNGMRNDIKTLQTASNLYFKAISIYPYRGKYYYILAELTAFNYDYFGSMYWCIRADSCRDPDDCKKQLSEIFEKAERV